ncbi:MAG: asparagine synthase (glutamine-hydrolyzing) [Nitrospirae bacterium]|nr:asparagine synthase (glutamine-hydrolyzing) [Nitrospirota bacterium]MBF0536210.1 asparagine synthase (glutamine-hydrolyzing) [Nitrospirota bacterium]MBF0617314.1 asparagine synthase (glutamine-hydrolyzing) [Nitrospirota bacterium]
MCGIAGIFTVHSERLINEDILLKMGNALIHRGPDDTGYYRQKHLALVFKRLSIVDLTTGNQPMYNEDRTIVSVCNGEIFNFLELKEELIQRGHIFYTHCDVEVLVHLYEEHGDFFVEKLNGQFSFAIYDIKRKRLLLARDQAGITPLFYTMAEGTFVFASEIKSILCHHQIKKEVDLRGLDQVLSFPGLVSPTTMFKGIFSLKPGHTLTASIDEGTIRLNVKEYWDLIYPEERQADYQMDESYYVERLDEIFRQSVNYRLMADVPVGFYLSGGLDSSLIGAVIKSLSPAEKRHSFSIAFNDSSIDESVFQRLMADSTGSIHSEVVFDWPDISTRFKDMIYHAECPVKESYNTCSMALSKLVRENGLKVILTGEGSDELFAGYVGYRFDAQRAAAPDSGYGDTEKMLEDEQREILWGDRDFFYEKNHYSFRETKLALYSEALREGFDGFDCVCDSLVDKSKLINRHVVHKRSYLDFKLRLSDHLVGDHGDRMAYANSVEARYPFLDVNLMDFAKTVPPDLKLRGFTEKYIVKKVSEKYLPERIINREKFGFVAPGSPFLLKQDIEWLSDTLSYSEIKKQGYFDPNTVERLKKIYKTDGFTLNLPFDSDLLMTVISFGVFMDVFDMPHLG